MNLNELYEKRNDFFVKDNSTVRNTFMALAVVGLLVLGYGFSVDPVRTWGAILMNNVFFFFISLGGVLLGCMTDTVGAVWNRPIKRIHESFGTFFTIRSW